MTNQEAQIEIRRLKDIIDNLQLSLKSHKQKIVNLERAKLTIREVIAIEQDDHTRNQLQIIAVRSSNGGYIIEVRK